MMNAEKINPFAYAPPAALEAVQKMLRLLKGVDEHGECRTGVEQLSDIEAADDFIKEHLDHWRAARGEAGMQAPRWWLKGSDDEAFNVDYATREDALRDAPQRLSAGCINAPDGIITICEARCWNDEFDIGDDYTPFADSRNEETMHVSYCTAKAEA